jgi:hypothetical protein
MVNQNGQPISLEPKCLLAPAKLETAAQKGLASEAPSGGHQRRHDHELAGAGKQGR